MRIFTSKVFLVVAIFTANTGVSANAPIELSCVLSSASRSHPETHAMFPDTKKPRQIDEKFNIVIELSVHDNSLPRPEELVRVEVHKESLSDAKIAYTGRMTDTVVVASSPPFDFAGVVSQTSLLIQRKSGDILMFDSNDEHGEVRAFSYKWGVCKKAEAPVF